MYIIIVLCFVLIVEARQRVRRRHVSPRRAMPTRRRRDALRLLLTTHEFRCLLSSSLASVRVLRTQPHYAVRIAYKSDLPNLESHQSLIDFYKSYELQSIWRK